MTKLNATLILTLLAASQLAFGASSSASFQATFVINESCTVQSSNKVPVVTCQFNTPYQVANLVTNTSTSASRSEQTSATLLTVTF